MTSPFLHRLRIMLWTSESHTRIRLQHWWLTVVIYAGTAAVMVPFTDSRTVSGDAILIWSLLVACSLSVFHYLIRSGWSKRLADPALAQAQILFAVLAVMAGYAITGIARSAVLLPLVLALNFGAFSIRWRRMVELTLFALAIMASAIIWMHVQWPGRYSTTVDLSNFLVSMVTLPGVAGLAMRLNALQARLQQHRVDLKDALDRIQELATRDDLTGLVNRRRARELLSEMALVEDSRRPFAVALIDLDSFKQLNDRFGHSGGDQVLRRFSDEARALVRSVDTVARWGGEEFLILMPATEEAFAFELVERLRLRIAALRIDNLAGKIAFTFSAGIATHRAGYTMDDTIARADQALYAAKNAGRNRVDLALETEGDNLHWCADDK